MHCNWLIAFQKHCSLHLYSSLCISCFFFGSWSMAACWSDCEWWSCTLEWEDFEIWYSVVIRPLYLCFFPARRIKKYRKLIFCHLISRGTHWFKFFPTLFFGCRTVMQVRTLQIMTRGIELSVCSLPWCSNYKSWMISAKVVTDLIQRGKFEILLAVWYSKILSDQNGAFIRKGKETGGLFLFLKRTKKGRKEKWLIVLIKRRKVVGYDKLLVSWYRTETK
jgi:hypothetical protein